jgi:hypothetical protein
MQNAGLLEPRTLLLSRTFKHCAIVATILYFTINILILIAPRIRVSRAKEDIRVIHV